MWNANVVSAAGQAILAGYLAFTLWRGARTAPRRELARGLGAFALYATLLGASFAIPGQIGSVLNASCLVAAAWSTAAVNATEPAPARTAAGVALGTLAYMAPELARGTGAAAPGRDVFASGILAHELLEGRNPFAMPPVLDALGGRATESPGGAPRNAPPQVGALLRACVDPDPAARPTAAEVSAAWPC